MKYIYKDWLIDILRKCFVLFIEMNRLGKNGTLTMEAKNIQQLILYEDNLIWFTYFADNNIFTKISKNISKQSIIITTRPHGKMFC